MKNLILTVIFCLISLVLFILSIFIKEVNGILLSCGLITSGISFLFIYYFFQKEKYSFNIIIGIVISLLGIVSLVLNVLWNYRFTFT